MKKSHHPTLALLISQLAAEDQPALAGFLEEHRDSCALALLETATTAHVADEITRERDQMMRDLAVVAPEKFEVLEKKIEEIGVTLFETTQEKPAGNEAMKEDILRTVEATNARMRDTLFIALAVMFTLNLLGVFGAWWFATETGFEADADEPVTSSNR